MERGISFAHDGLLIWIASNSKDYMFVSAEAIGVAVKRKIFDEGAERIVREFREVNNKGVFVGSSMVWGRRVASLRVLTTKEIKRRFIHVSTKLSSWHTSLLVRSIKDWQRCPFLMLHHYQQLNFSTVPYT